MQKQKGFTLIELVVVIVILGILAAVAAPKFIDVSSDARIATLNGLEGAIKSGNSLVKSKAILENKDKSTTAVDVDDIETIYGEATATAAALTELLDNNVADWQFATVTTAGTIEVRPADLADDAVCTLIYTQATATSGATTSLANVSGC